MGRTFNRPPAQFKTPSNNEIKSYYFNHYNWKGIDRNKNFLAVDQETFADAKNVYMDEEGLLKTRPSLKYFDHFSYGNILDRIQSINSELVIIQSREDDAAYLVAAYVPSVSDNSNQYGKFFTGTTPKYIVKNDKVIFFNDRQSFYWDSISAKFKDLSELIYIPETRYLTAATITNLETKNILTEKEINVYHYDTIDGYNPELHGKKVTAEIDDKILDIEFTDENKNIILRRIAVLTNPERFTVSSRGSMAFMDSSGFIYHSATGHNFSFLCKGYGTNDHMEFSDDGNSLIVRNTDLGKIGIISVLSDKADNSMRYPNLTDLTSIYKQIELGTPTLIRFHFVSYNDFVLIVRKSADIYCYIFNGGELKFEGSLEYTFEALSISFVDYVKLDPVNNVMYCVFVAGNEHSYVGYMNYVENYSSWRSYSINVDYSPLDCAVVDNNFLLLTHGYNDLNLSLGFYSFDGYQFLSNKIPAGRKRGRIGLSGSSVITDVGIYNISRGETVNFLDEDLIVLDSDNFVYGYKISDDYAEIYSSNIVNHIDFKYLITGDDVNIAFTHILDTGSSVYFSYGRNIYVGEFRDDNGVLKLYIPEISKHEFASEITGLHQISQTEIAIFFENEIYYAVKTDLGYAYYKSKIDLGLKKGNNIITSDDGSQVLFMTKNGLASLSYQNFIASVEQKVTFLTDAVRVDIEKFAKNIVKICKYSYWLMMYDYRCTNTIWLYDLRNGACWYWDFPIKFNNAINFKDDVIFCSFNPYGKNQSIANTIVPAAYIFDWTSDAKDMVFLFSNNDSVQIYDKEIEIDWHVTSQKLHLNAIDYYKHISNITISTVLDETDDNKEFSVDMEVINYRDYMHKEKEEMISYKVQLIRTFVKKLNYMKVNEFQYTLKADKDSAIKLPLSLSNIGIKYKIVGQVR